MGVRRIDTQEAQVLLEGISGKLEEERGTLLAVVDDDRALELFVAIPDRTTRKMQT